jgi:hypothetical protein
MFRTVCVIQFCRQLASRIRADPTPDDGRRNCPKHIEFHSKNKFEKLVHLVGFIISFDIRCNISFKEHLPEDGHSMWPKHVGDTLFILQQIYLFVTITNV